MCNFIFSTPTAQNISKSSNVKYDISINSDDDSDGFITSNIKRSLKTVDSIISLVRNYFILFFHSFFYHIIKFDIMLS